MPVQDLRGHGLCRKPGQGRRPKEEYSQVGFHRVNCFWRMAVLQAIWRIKSLGLVKLICLLSPHGKGYFVCAKPKVVGVQWSKCVQCIVECIVCSVHWSKTNSLSRKWLCCLIASPHAIHCLQQFEYVRELSWSYGRQSSKARNPKVHFPKTDLTFLHLCHW